MNAHPKPLPDLGSELTAPFWRGTREHRLLIQRCESCGYLRWTPSPLCPECLATGGAWTEVEPEGTLLSFATYHRALAPAFADDLPYTIGLVQLRSGPRLYGLMVASGDAPVVGSPVRAVFEEVTGAVTFIRWAVQPHGAGAGN